jgi:hypothetical protein
LTFLCLAVGKAGCSLHVTGFTLLFVFCIFVQLLTLSLSRSLLAHSLFFIYTRCSSWRCWRSCLPV